MITLVRLRNAVTGVALALLGGATLVASSSFAWGQNAANDAALFPRTIAILLIVVGIIIGAAGIIQARRGDVALNEAGEGIPIDVEIPEELVADREPEGTDARAGILTAALVLVYSASAFTLGFITSTVLFLAAGSLVLGHGRGRWPLVKLGIFAVALAAIYYIGFFVLLGVREPNTLLP